MFDWTFLLISFGGGIFGAMVGALPNFIICGLAALVGAGIAAATDDSTFMNLVAWGPFLGPQVGFAGGAAASVYAANKGKLESGRDIVTALAGLNSPDVLLIGGLFGMLGYVLQWLLGQVPAIGGQPWTNTIALSVVINAIIARLAFGKTGVFGKVEDGQSRWVATEVASWIPWQADPFQLLVIGLGGGLVTSYLIDQLPGMIWGVWAISAVFLVFLQYGTKVPVTHHISGSAAVAVAVFGGDLWWGVAFALLAVYLGEISACLFTCHGDSHIDPPSVALVATWTLQALASALGLFEIGGMVSLAVSVAVGLLGYLFMRALKVSGEKVTVKPQVEPAVD